MKERSRPEDYILSFGLGVPTLSGRKSIKRYETYCDLHFSDRFSQSEREEYNLSGHEYLKAVIKNKIPKLIIDIGTPFLDLEKYGYIKIVEVEMHSVYQKRESVNSYARLTFLLICV